jgi:hypothetical protein
VAGKTPSRIAFIGSVYHDGFQFCPDIGPFCKPPLYPILIALSRDAWNVYVHAPSSVETGFPQAAHTRAACRLHGDEAMPQIWMTYGEIAALLGCTAEAARVQVLHRSLDRKKSRDGLTRVKLDSDWTAHFVAVIRDADPALDQAIRDLYNIRSEMARDAGRVFRHEAAAHQAEFAIKRGR